jgi:hypothetical protein
MPEVVDGVKTTKYTGSQDVSAFFPKGSNNPAAAVLKDVRTVPYELYIDEDDLLRRMVIDLTTQGVTIKTIMDFFDYGKPVAIAAPAAAQTKPGGQGEASQVCFPKSVRGRPAT